MAAPVAGGKIATSLNRISGPAGWYLISFPFESISQFSGWEGPLFTLQEGAYSRKTARAVRPGQGFWLYSKSSLNLIVDGDLNESVAETVRLKSGWNMIGNPYPAFFSWSEAQVLYDNTRLNVTDAEHRGWLLYTLIGYDPSSSAYHKVLPGGYLEPWKGYWIYSSVTCDLVFLNPEKSGAAANLELRTDSSSIPADGKNTSKVVVKVTDRQGTPLPYKMVQFSASEGSIKPDKLATDGNGEGAVYVSATKAGMAQITARAGNVTGTCAISYTAPSAPPDSRKGELTVLATLPEEIRGAGDGIVLADKSVRLYFDTGGEIGTVSSPDGIEIKEKKTVALKSVKEEGMVGGPSIIRLDDGRYRLYYDTHKKLENKMGSWIYSAISDDGIHWEREGLCFRTRHESDFAGTASVTKTREGHYRLYFGEKSGLICSARSYDGRNWEEEDGERGRGADADVDLLPDGTYLMVYTMVRSDMSKADIWCATSKDGLKFENHRLIATCDDKARIYHDPFIVLYPDGKMRIYFLRDPEDSPFYQIKAAEFLQ
ncbi:MAG: Ig-like domain-containing protein [Vulcanimicrobiota bacterium]